MAAAPPALTFLSHSVLSAPYGRNTAHPCSVGKMFSGVLKDLRAYHCGNCMVMSSCSIRSHGREAAAAPPATNVLWGCRSGVDHADTDVAEEATICSPERLASVESENS